MTAATAGRGRLRASHSDREHVVEVLKAAFVQGRLTKDEFDMRVGQTFADLRGTGRAHCRHPRRADRSPVAAEARPGAGPAPGE
jgi:hypothetical protein